MKTKKITGFALNSPEERIKFAKLGGSAFKKKLDENPELKKLNKEHLASLNKKNWENPEVRKKLLKNIDWTGRTHSDETKQKLSEVMSKLGHGTSNSQYGTCWITKDGTNKKIKKDDLNSFMKEGWVKGRK